MKEHDSAIATYYDHSSAPRVHTCTVFAEALRKRCRFDDQIVITPEGKCNLLGFAQSGAESASYSPIALENDWNDHKQSLLLSITSYVSPRHRTEQASLAETVLLGKYEYRYKGNTFLVYLVDGRDGAGSYPTDRFFFLVHPDKAVINELILEAGRWTNELHDEIWVFDSGYWQKSADLFDSIRNASWDAVILDEGMKKAIVEEHLSFFRSKDVYRKLQIPWKRGLLYYGPPGNGKSISIKATMNMLYKLADPIPTLYVRSLVSYGGPEMSIRMIFDKARSLAPCYMVLEDLDTIVTEQVKSYFFNEVDGLKANDGIFMIGSTNHLDRLDPGISQRPSRFDRKYMFPDPDEEQRVAYCHFWQKKLKSNESIEFPDALCPAIAKITDKFSFAYLQEAFVATLLVIAKDTEFSHADGGDDWLDVQRELAHHTDEGEDDELDKYVLWREIKKQVDILRRGLGSEG